MTFLSASLQLDDGFQIEFGVCEKQTGSCVYVCLCMNMKVFFFHKPVRFY